MPNFTFEGKEWNQHGAKKLNAERGAAGKTAAVNLEERDGKAKAKPVPHTGAATLQGTFGRM